MIYDVYEAPEPTTEAAATSQTGSTTHLKPDETADSAVASNYVDASNTEAEVHHAANGPDSRHMSLPGCPVDQLKQEDELLKERDQRSTIWRTEQDMEPHRMLSNTNEESIRPC